ncbi:hypothetical protein IF2G_02922 [Cordyceps javanica]|nr:hypothetical protein IF2G_02922 [Cordyceps javanica]
MLIFPSPPPHGSPAQLGSLFGAAPPARTSTPANVGQSSQWDSPASAKPPNTLEEYETAETKAPTSSLPFSRLARSQARPVNPARPSLSQGFQSVTAGDYERATIEIPFVLHSFLSFFLFSDELFPVCCRI